jgi:molecular chaperone DnaK (HSP70)
MSKNAFGIHFGATSASIAYVDPTGYPTVIENKEGQYNTPAVVNFLSPNTVVVGDIAKKEAEINPGNTIQLVLTLMGKTDFAYNHQGKDLSPEEVAALILIKVTHDAADLMDTKVQDVIITCPDDAGVTTRRAIETAAEVACLNVLDVVDESIAAVTYYGFTEEYSPKNVLVYDSGGNSFCATIMQVNCEEMSIISSGCDADLGERQKNFQCSYIRHCFELSNKHTNGSGDGT